MKRLAAVLLMMAFIVPCVASADVLADGWEDAGLDELIDAQEQIGQRIKAIRAESAISDDLIVLTGSGTTIVKEPITISAIPARVTVKGNVQLTLTGGIVDFVYNKDSMAYDCDDLTYTGQYTALIEGVGDWEITIEKIRPGGSFDAGGTGHSVSDFFTFTEPTIVDLVIDKSMTTEIRPRMHVYMGRQHKYDDGWGLDILLDDSFYSDQRIEKEIIVKPEDGRTEYYWIVDVPEGVEWSITAK